MTLLWSAPTGSVTGRHAEYAHGLALLVLPVVAAIGLLTFVRLGQANSDDIGLVIGMNRLRRDISRSLRTWSNNFITASHDDQAGILRSSGAAYRPASSREPRLLSAS